jgi:hypothetical protein
MTLENYSELHRVHVGLLQLPKQLLLPDTQVRQRPCPMTYERCYEVEEAKLEPEVDLRPRVPWQLGTRPPRKPVP